MRGRHNLSPAKPGKGFRTATRIRNNPQKPLPHKKGCPFEGQPLPSDAAARTQKLTFAPTNQLRGSDGP
ncbi:hypothetical protein CE91St16_10160 [Alistipes finegoldii]|uniref:Uncharacterized protein n=1 Tax=Alistipes finegoldii TaxID=214856 RepID=A0AA37KPX6_9BACT|nr:hypothetical protein CE91St15_20970 [Alistipes finegoldii]GKI18108.1 hypothetical protein CE91St16_10160 [Alistipes finegoldii]